MAAPTFQRIAPTPRTYLPRNEFYTMTYSGSGNVTASLQEVRDNQFPPGPARDQCITDAYIACGPRPTLRVDERVLEQLVDLFKGPVRP